MNLKINMMLNHYMFLSVRYSSNLRVPTKMKAWQIYKYGELNELRLTSSFQIPIITNVNQVLIKVEAASVNPIDISLIHGYGSSIFNIVRKYQNVNEFPRTLGRDFSGTVLKVGNSVKLFKPGMEVVGALWPFEEGSHAEYLVCNQNQIALKPQKLNFSEAAALPYAGLTAYSALMEYGGLKAGNAQSKRILILGGSGGVGTIALQLAKACGAYVAVSCREGSEDLLIKLGADAIHNGASSGQYDIILDCVDDDVQSVASLLKPGVSKYITLRHSFIRLLDDFTPFLGIPLAGIELTRKFLKHLIDTNGSIYHWAFFRASGRNLSTLGSLVDRGLIKPVVHASYPFEEAAQAFSSLHSGGVKGKLIVHMDSSSTSQILPKAVEAIQSHRGD